MLPFGKLRQIQGTRAQVLSGWSAGLEQAGCEVTQAGDGRLNVVVPGWDASLLTTILGASEAPEQVWTFQRWFWDRMLVTVDTQGNAAFRMVYFSPAQLFLHVLITAVYSWQAWFGDAMVVAPASFLASFALAQLIPGAVALMGFHFARESALRRALNREADRATG